MLHDTPLRPLHEAYRRHSLSAHEADGDVEGLPRDRPSAAAATELEWLPYGPPGADESASCAVIASFGVVELEYAAIRRGAGLLDSPQRGTIQITGDRAERRSFLNRMVTQELKGLAPAPAPGSAAAAFWLNRRGRIDADLLIAELGDRLVISLDAHQAAPTAAALAGFLFAEDLRIDDVSSSHHHVMAHGPVGRQALAVAANEPDFDLPEASARVIRIDATEVIAVRCDQAGTFGCELIMPFDRAAGVWEFLLATNEVLASGRRRVRPIGWHAYNIARLEAGTPLFNIDFGPTNLPHETGLLDQRVSFTKGCYLGQEVVARMQHLGKPKQMLVRLRLERDVLPVAGAQVFAMKDEGMGEAVGVVTSSTLSPMLGAAPIALAMVRASAAVAGAKLLVSAEGEQAVAFVAPLRSPPDDRGADGSTVPAAPRGSPRQ